MSQPSDPNQEKSKEVDDKKKGSETKSEKDDDDWGQENKF